MDAYTHTPLEPGVRLSKADCPTFVNPALHHKYWGITGHLLYLVTMKRCYLALAYVELSKFVQSPGEAHLQAAEQVLKYL